MISIPYQEARLLLKEGDVLLFRGQGMISKFVKVAGEGKYSHVAIVSLYKDNGNSMWECVEFREGKGGRTVGLEEQVKQNPGIIDVFRPADSMIKNKYSADTNIVSEIKVQLYAKGVTTVMRKMTGLPYGWRRIWFVLKHKMPFLRFLYNVDSVVDDSTQELVYPVCSTAVAYAFNKMGYDLIPHRADQWTEPSDLARSASLSYLFTLQP